MSTATRQARPDGVAIGSRFASALVTSLFGSVHTNEMPICGRAGHAGFLISTSARAAKHADIETGPAHHEVSVSAIALSIAVRQHDTRCRRAGAASPVAARVSTTAMTCDPVGLPVR